MLSEANLATQFWAEAVNTACYTQNRSLTVKRFRRTPYELFRNRKPSIEHLDIFGCVCYILNNKDNLGKQAIEETIHVKFDESGPTFPHPHENSEINQWTDSFFQVPEPSIIDPTPQDLPDGKRKLHKLSTTAPEIDDSDSSQHLGSTISPFEKKSEWWWKLQCRLPLGHLQVLFPLAYDPCSHLHRSLSPSVHHPHLELLLDQPHCLQQLSFSINDSPTWNLIRQQSALHAIIDIEKGPVAEPGELSKPHKPALLLLLSDVQDSVLRYPGWHVRRVGIDTRNEQVRSQQVDLRLAAFYGKLVVRHSRERDCVTDVFLQYLRAISVVFWSEDRALKVLDDRDKVF
ncbi:hypothetical protein OSB04_016565 [Centaurea solstitialis]|uniref:Retrovirus-related Pol polyprotein from transposon TNT 1-94 n=1 Tax=Centaurea solstitialis TaxID=347529 RepID=A0AA38TD28_9ASTR|nr:hypothetical protein OSB04_016565 [Centaurea solstitialis]